MISILKMAREQAHLSEVMPKVLQQTEGELRAEVSLANDDERALFYLWMKRQARTTGNWFYFQRGCLFYMTTVLSDATERPALIDEHLAEFEISMSTAYSDRQIFANLGPLFLPAHEGLLAQLPGEALRVLARNGTSQLARIQAIDVLKTGKRLSLKDTKQLLLDFPEIGACKTPLSVAKHDAPIDESDDGEGDDGGHEADEKVAVGSDTEIADGTWGVVPKTGTKSRKSQAVKTRSEPFWSFTGVVAKIVVEPMEWDGADLSAMRQDFLAALDQLDAQLDQIIHRKDAV